MSRIGFRFAAPLVLLTAVTVACSDNQPAGPTNQGVTLDPQIGNLSSCSVAQDSVDAMLPQLFTPGSDRGKSVSTYNQMQKSLRQNKDAAALGYMKQIVDLAFKDFYANPSKITGGRTPHTAALLMDLVQGLYCLNTGTLLPDFEVPLGGTGAVVTPGAPATVALVDDGGKKRAASQFGINSLPTSTEAVPFYIVTITPITTSFSPKSGPLNTQLAQYGPYYEFSIEPALPESGFPDPVLTGVCINSTADVALNLRLRLAHDNEFGPIDTDDGNFRFGKIEIIGQAGAVDLSPLGLDCTGLPVAPVGFLRKAASYFLPAPLFAATSPATTGGKVKTYSPFGAVDPAGLPPGFGATGYSFYLTSDPGSAPEGWQTSSFPNGWSEGGAPFGTLDYCGVGPNALPPVVTAWGIGNPSYVLVRKDFVVPAGTTSATIQVLVDNDVQVYVNGTDVSDGLRIHEGCANDGPVAPFVVNAPTLVAGVNKLAIIAKDRGGQSYFDVKVTLAP